MGESAQMIRYLPDHRICADGFRSLGSETVYSFIIFAAAAFFRKML
jgi:hypothetical protein